MAKMCLIFFNQSNSWHGFRPCEGFTHFPGSEITIRQDLRHIKYEVLLTPRKTFRSGRCSCRNVILLSGFVNLTTLADSENEDYEVVVVYFVDDAIVACAHAPFAASTDELNRFRWPWVDRQEFGCSVNSVPN